MRDSYRKNNFIASDNRETRTVRIHPALALGLHRVAKEEKKTVSWLVETALSDYFGVEVLLRKLKSKPKPSYRMKDNLKIVVDNSKTSKRKNKRKAS